MAEVYLVRVWLVLTPDPANLPPSSKLLEMFGARFTREVEWEFAALALDATGAADPADKLNALFDQFRATIVTDNGLKDSDVKAIAPFASGGWVPGRGGLHEGDSPVFIEFKAQADPDEWRIEASGPGGGANAGRIRAKCEWKKVTVK